MLDAADLGKRFPVGRGRMLHALDDVSLTIPAGGSLGLVGESGSGKSTLARVVARLLSPDEGKLVFDGRDIGALAPRAFARDPLRRAIQLVFQSADDSLNPAFTATASIRMSGGPAADGAAVAAVAHEVGIAPELLSRRPHQLSGGQQARVGIARAILPNPRLLILDEPTASLDVSVQAAVLKLIDKLRRDRSMALLFVSHDLEVVRLMCSEVMVLYLGRIAERGPVERVLAAPAHPYTRALLAASPGRRGVPLAGEPLSPIDPPKHACLFHSRCPLAIDRCRSERPALREVAPGWTAACHRAGESLSV
jgi:oligopeptide/dipeptide ABC transporter ATP-binding protein